LERCKYRLTLEFVPLTASKIRADTAQVLVLD
jgi:hypothetical protein